MSILDTKLHICVSCSPPAFEVDSLDDLKYLAHERRLQTTRLPQASKFRVFCLMVVRDKGNSTRRIIEGSNFENGNICGAICAERSAIGSAAFRAMTDPLIELVVISTDSSECIAPGCLCREFMSAHASNTTKVVLLNHDRTKTAECLVNPIP